MTNPKVTIGMPSFNRAKTLKRAIEQVLNQTHQDFEFIIYNDGSTDNTVDVVNSFSDNRIIFINEKNKGLPHPLNKILELAKGEYIIILHDHDKFNPQLIEKSFKALEENPDAGFVLQACAWINSDEATGYQEFILDLPSLNIGRKFGEHLLLVTPGFSSPIHACCMVRRSAYEKVGKYYDEKFGWYTDVDLWLRLLREFNFIYLPEVLFVFTGREQNHLLSKKVWLIGQWQHEIFLENTHRFIQDHPEQENAIQVINTKIKRDNFRNLAAVIVSKNAELLKEGFDFLERSENFLFTKLLIRLLKTSNVLTRIIMQISSFINSFRKSITRVKT